MIELLQTGFGAKVPRYHGSRKLPSVPSRRRQRRDIASEITEPVIFVISHRGRGSRTPDGLVDQRGSATPEGAVISGRLYESRAESP